MTKILSGIVFAMKSIALVLSKLAGLSVAAMLLAVSMSVNAALIIMEDEVLNTFRPGDTFALAAAFLPPTLR